MPAPESAHPTYDDVGDHTQRQVKANPPGNEHATKVPMSDNKDVTSAFALLKILAVILANLYGLSRTSGLIHRSAYLYDHAIHARAHIVHTLAPRAANDQGYEVFRQVSSGYIPIPPDVPARLYG